ncbi:hypothetical protein LTR08_006033 [Meristemomyces frigidus]|nr:hypothetical protein LTR08_006033 [Meristemomyces frigidus]
MAGILWIRRACRSPTLQHPRLYTTAKRPLPPNSPIFRVSEEVRQALIEHRPVIALESTIYTHGFPHPANLALATRLEALVRANGGVPATIGILDGVATVGLTPPELSRLITTAHATPSALLKCSRRDLAFATALTSPTGARFNGGTTVSATMILAHMAGIRVFATGGLGGVHRDVATTLDISADLTELGRTPIAVISSGCKAFLDIAKTLEYLETQGVAVATFADGRDVSAAESASIDFPAFWSRDSGVKSPMLLRDESEAARVIHAHGLLGLQSGLHFANPIPERYSIPRAEMEAAVKQALEQAALAGATGARSTPFVLARVGELTGGASGRVNRVLVEGNVVRGTRVAVELGRIEGEGDRPDRLESRLVGPAASHFTSTGVSLGASASQTPAPATHQATAPAPPPTSPADQSPTIFVAGSLNVDLSCDYTPRPNAPAHTPEPHTSNPATIAQTLGGVAHNVARAAHLLGAPVRLCSAVGADPAGHAALAALAASGMSVAGVTTLATGRTSQYVAVNDTHKALVLAMADVTLLEQPTPALTSAFETSWLPDLRAANPSHVVLDANWPPAALARWLAAAHEADAPPHITFEPVSNAKSTSLFHLPPHIHTLATFPHPTVHLATPNSSELAALAAAARATGAFDRADWWAVLDALGIPSTGARAALASITSPALVDAGVPQQSLQLLPFIPAILTKLGARGVLLTQLLPAGDPRLTSPCDAPYILCRCRNGTEAGLGVGGVYMRLFPAVEKVPAADVVSVNGVGDTFAGAIVAGLAKRGSGARVEELVDVAQRAAVMTLRSAESVCPRLGALRGLL